MSKNKPMTKEDRYKKMKEYANTPSCPKAKKKIHKVMEEFKEGELNIGKSKKKVRNRKQAIAIALNMGRKAK